MPSVSAIILAGGQSRRMGRPKATLTFGHCTILERLIETLRTIFDDIVIMAAPKQSEVFPIEHLLRTASPSVHLLRDQTAYQGAAVALAQGLAAVANDVVFACSCDSPLLRVEVIHALYGMLNGYEAVIPDIGGQPQPLCAVYRRDVAKVIETQLASGERRLTQITAELRAHRPGELQLRKFDPDLRSFMNVNSPEDYNLALAIEQLHESGKSR